jgi:hypothetical protein
MAEKTFAVVVNDCFLPAVEVGVVQFGRKSFVWVGGFPINRGSGRVCQWSMQWFVVTLEGTTPGVFVI